MTDPIDLKLNDAFEGRCVRKDLVQRIKKGTNIPTFVLEFLLAKYCATDDPDEIDAGLQAVNETIQGNYVRPNESNAAQSRVQQNGTAKFIDKVHVHHSEREKRHWAEMENFGSKRIAINEKHYRENKRLLEGGLWCEVTVGYNQVEDDDYTFYVDDLRPIQIARFQYDDFVEARREFTRDEWLIVLLRTLGLEAAEMDRRLQFHLLARVFPFVEPNYNFIELGPRGTGKSYAYSEFSPYSTLLSGGQTTTATLFYNKVRRQVGIIGYWDVVAFDEVAGIKVKDPGTIQILKDYMANGHFNLATEVMASASLAFVGNIDDSIEQLVRSEQFDLFKPLPKEFDLAIIHRFHTYVPGWEIPPNSTKLLTQRYGLITDYLAEAFHHLAHKENLYSIVKKRAKLGSAVEGRDETATIKTVCALCKLLHPGGEPTDAEFDEYVAYALEGRRRVKEQLNKRKSDDEFADIAFTFTNAAGEEIEVHCPESKGVDAMQTPVRKELEQEDGKPAKAAAPVKRAAPQTPDETPQSTTVVLPSLAPELQEKTIDIHYGDAGFSYESLFGGYLVGAKKVRVEDPYIRTHHQVVNFLRFCEVCASKETITELTLVTSFEHEFTKDETAAKLDVVGESLANRGIVLKVEYNQNLHDREITTNTGWSIRIGRGLDIYQRPEDRLEIGALDLDLRQCMETKVTIVKVPGSPTTTD